MRDFNDIKFRAWLKNPDRMYQNSINYAFFSVLSEERGYTPVVMQYTGLKDKNGVDVYEGDIVNCHIFVQELGENFGVTEGEREFVAEVLFGVEGVQVRNENFSDNPVHYEQFHEESLEVIGNIYENPALLTAPSPDKASK